jgi:hypothetical protein
MKKGFLTALGLILIILACGPEWEAWETQEAMANNKKTDIYGYPIPAPQDSVPVPEGLPPNALKLESAPGELNPAEYFSGKPIALMHENKYREINSKGIISKSTFIFNAGINELYRSRYFSNPIPDDTAFRITEIREMLSVDAATANIDTIISDYFIVQDTVPIYYGTIEVRSIPNNGVPAVSTLYFHHDQKIKVDIWVPRQSKLGVVKRMRTTNVTVAGVAKALGAVILQGYLATPPYPLGKGLNAELDVATFTANDWLALQRRYETF